MSADSSESGISILQQRCDLLDTRIKGFTTVNNALQRKAEHLLEYINRQEDYCGLLSKEYDEVSNDVICVQALVDKFMREREDLLSRIQLFRAIESSKMTQSATNVSTNPTVILPPSEVDTPFILTNRLRLRAHLPNAQFTLVEVKPGQQVQQALGKKLSHRGLKLQQLVVYRASSGLPVSWEDDAMQLALMGEDLIVDYAKPAVKRPEHQFQRKTFFDKVRCNACQKSIFHGTICKLCGAAFHQRCVSRTDQTCSAALEEGVFDMVDQFGAKYAFLIRHFSLSDSFAPCSVHLVKQSSHRCMFWQRVKRIKIHSRSLSCFGFKHPQSRRRFHSKYKLGHSAACSAALLNVFGGCFPCSSHRIPSCSVLENPSTIFDKHRTSVSGLNYVFHQRHARQFWSLPDLTFLETIAPRVVPPLPLCAEYPMPKEQQLNIEWYKKKCLLKRLTPRQARVTVHSHDLTDSLDIIPDVTGSYLSTSKLVRLRSFVRRPAPIDTSRRSHSVRDFSVCGASPSSSASLSGKKTLTFCPVHVTFTTSAQALATRLSTIHSGAVANPTITKACLKHACQSLVGCFVPLVRVSAPVDLSHHSPTPSVVQLSLHTNQSSFDSAQPDSDEVESNQLLFAKSSFLNLPNVRRVHSCCFAVRTLGVGSTHFSSFPHMFILLVNWSAFLFVSTQGVVMVTF